MTAAVLTVSDKCFAGERIDESGPILTQILKNAGYSVPETALVPDEQPLIEVALLHLCARGVTLIFTTGGTGFALRDVTPEATRAIGHRNADGVAEAIRAFSMGVTQRAMLSRAVAVLRNDCLIVNLPGSPKAARECAEYVLPHLQHGLEVLKGAAGECAQKP